MNMKWSELFPEGRHIYYEGDEPEAFAVEMVEKYGFDPRKSEHWGYLVPADDENEEAFLSYGFFCPVDALDEVYGNGKYQLGS